MDKLRFTALSCPQSTVLRTFPQRSLKRAHLKTWTELRSATKSSAAIQNTPNPPPPNCGSHHSDQFNLTWQRLSAVEKGLKNTILYHFNPLKCINASRCQMKGLLPIIFAWILCQLEFNNASQPFLNWSHEEKTMFFNKCWWLCQMCPCSELMWICK